MSTLIQCQERIAARRAIGRAAVILATASLGACSDPRPPRPEIEQRPSTTANRAFHEAQVLYAASRWRDDRGPALRASRDELIRKLVQVIHLAPDCPLFYSKLGDVRLELGPEAYSLAHEDYRASLQACRNWAPGHLGLARHALLAGRDVAAAEEHLRDAEKALRAVAEWAAWDDTPRRDGSGATRDADADDPRLSPAEASALMACWLEWNELWYPENPPLFGGESLGAGGRAGPGARADGLPARAAGKIERRLRARIEYIRAEVMLTAGRSAADVVAQLDRSLRWDADFVTATMEKARQYRRLEQFAEAESLLEPFMREAASGHGTPGAFSFARNGRMLFEYATLHAQRYLASRDPRFFDEANDHFATLLNEVSLYNAEAWLSYATLLRVAGADHGRREILQDAQKYAERAAALDPQLPGLATEREAIAAALGRAEGR